MASVVCTYFFVDDTREHRAHTLILSVYDSNFTVTQAMGPQERERQGAIDSELSYMIGQIQSPGRTKPNKNNPPPQTRKQKPPKRGETTVRAMRLFFLRNCCLCTKHQSVKRAEACREQRKKQKENQTKATKT